MKKEESLTDSVGDAENDGTEATGGKKHRYCVLCTQVLKQERLRDVLKKSFPRGRGTVFCPRMETFRRGAGGARIEICAMFPGYVFIRSDMDVRELHGFIKSHRREIDSYIRELRLSEKRASGDTPFGDEENGGKAAAYVLSDLSDDEAEFMDFLLGADSNGEVSVECASNPAGAGCMESGKDGSGKPDACGSEEGLHTEGLLRMSYGYKENGKVRVMEGPLRAYEDRIEKVSAHDRKAYLDFMIGGRTVRAGLTLLPKRHWFPDDGNAPEVLGDGSEVDIRELVRAMTNLY